VFSSNAQTFLRTNLRDLFDDRSVAFVSERVLLPCITPSRDFASTLRGNGLRRLSLFPGLHSPAKQTFRSPIHSTPAMARSCGGGTSFQSSGQDSDCRFKAFVFCLPVALAGHTVHLSTKFNLIVTSLSSPSPVSIGDISRGDRATTLVLIS
jgi:hypothetical protein